jgi:hypothetical protein
VVPNIRRVANNGIEKAGAYVSGLEREKVYDPSVGVGKPEVA